MQIRITIHDETFTAPRKDRDAACDLVAQLPLTLQTATGEAR